MAVVVGDVLFARSGDPSLVRSKDANSGNVVLERDFASVQEHAKEGLKNGLMPEQREAYQATLSEVRDPDRRKEIDNLATKLNSLKETGGDPRVLRYLEQELAYRMTKERHVPRTLVVDPRNISSID